MKFIRTTDCTIIAKLNKYVHTKHYNMYPKYFKSYNYEDVHDFLKSYVDSDNHIFITVEEFNVKIGYIWIELVTKNDNAFSNSISYIYIHQIAIADKYQHMGYGSKLISKVYEIAKLYKIKEVRLDYWEGNVVAESFYKKQGFEKLRTFATKKIK